jgi:hypothetical protein
VDTLAIEQLVCAAIDKLLIDGKYQLRFILAEDRFSAIRHSHLNSWISEPSIDALSCLLLIHQIEPYCKGDKDLRLATLAKYLDRRTPWLESFHYAWYGNDNHGSSIGGYILGRKLRHQYLPK